MVHLLLVISNKIVNSVYNSRRTTEIGMTQYHFAVEADSIESAKLIHYNKATRCACLFHAYSTVQYRSCSAITYKCECMLLSQCIPASYCCCHCGCYCLFSTTAVLLEQLYCNALCYAVLVCTVLYCIILECRSLLQCTFHSEE